MTNCSAVFFAAAALAGTCIAEIQYDTQVKVLGRVAGTTEWKSSLEVPVSQIDHHVKLELAVVYAWSEEFGGIALARCVGSPSVFGWNSALDTVTLLDRPEGTQHPDGRQGNFNFISQRQQAYLDELGWTTRMRISGPFNAENNFNLGVSVRQNTPVALGTALDRGNNVIGFRFDVNLGLDVASGQTVRDLYADVPSSEILTFLAYNNPAGTSTVDLRLTPSFRESQPLPIRLVIPTPAACAVLGGGLGIMTSRRRR